MCPRSVQSKTHLLMPIVCLNDSPLLLCLQAVVAAVAVRLANTDLSHVALLCNPPLPARDIINRYDSRDGTHAKKKSRMHPSRFMVIVWRAETSTDATSLRLLDERRSLRGLWNISASPSLLMHCSTCLLEIILFEIVYYENRKRLSSVRQRD